MTTSISLLNYDVLVCIIIKELDEMRLDGLCSSNPLRIPHPKIDKLACQAQGAGIFAEGEISLLDANCIHFYRCGSQHWYYNTLLQKKQDFFEKFLYYLQRFFLTSQGIYDTIILLKCQGG